MHTLFAVAAIASSMGGSIHHDQCCLRGFAPSYLVNGHLATLPPEDHTRVYAPGHSSISGRLWVGRTYTSVHGSDRSVQLNPGHLAYGTVDTDERVHAVVNHVVVPISPWERYEAEGLQHLERARQQWLRERGLTNAVRTIVNPARARAAVDGYEVKATVERETDGFQPAATIRLREPRSEQGVIRGVRADGIHDCRIIAPQGEIRVSLPPMASRGLVERCEVRGWTREGRRERVVSAKR